MYKAAVIYNRRDYEYDVYSLVKAFYPEAEVTSLGPDDATGEFPCLITVQLEDESVCISVAEEGEQTLEGTCSLADRPDRREVKNRLKRLLYELLSEKTGRTLPWGTLTGIRPTKIPMQLLEAGQKNVQIAAYMRNTYLTSNEKTALAITVANREKALLEPIDYEQGFSLYVGIPFCPSICLYCTFGSHPLKQWQKRVDEYLDALEKELRAAAKLFTGRPLQTIYIGGGTPTTLSAGQLGRLLSLICELFDLKTVREFTLEAGRPDTITVEKLHTIRQFPVNRISINPQTMNQKTLDIIGRKHTVDEIKEAYFMARMCGFDNINMDLILGLPGEEEADVRHTLEEIRAMDPDSLTVHALALKRAARLNLFKDIYAPVSFKVSDEIMKACEQAARDMDMGPYYMYRQKNMAGNFENVGYAKVDKAGIYNILIMEEKQTILACGAGASTKLVFDRGSRIERVENVKSVEHYIARIDEMILRKQEGIGRWLKQ